MKKKVGPLPLLGGLQTQPAEGRPTGLFRVLNMEARDALLQTRRGQVELPAMVDRFNAGAGGVCSTVPANPSTGTIIGIGLPVNLTADSVACVVLTLNAQEAAIDTTYTAEYFSAVDLAWHPLSFHNSNARVSSFFNSLDAPFYTTYLEFVVPFGWGFTTPPDLPGSPGAAAWIRLTKSSNWTSTAVQIALTSGSEIQDKPLAMIAPITRAGRGPFSVIAQIVAGVARYDVVDVNVATTANNYHVMFGGTGTDCLYLSSFAIPVDGDKVWMLYVPDTDTILCHLSGGYYTINASKGASEANAAAVFAPDVNERYSDIGCENSLPRSRKAIIFGKRIFLLGAGAPSRVQWSAPGAFWTTWPSANVADLGGGAGGELLGGATDDRQLFLFTSSSIWTGVLGDPTAGNESDFFLDITEETPCASGDSIVATPSGIVFLSDDGVRVFDGKRSKRIGRGVLDLFRPNSDHPLACLRKSTAIGAYHPIENQYWMLYASPGARHNDTILIVDLDDDTAYLWGADTIDTLQTGGVGQRERGVRGLTLAWSEKMQSMVMSTPGLFFTKVGEGDTDLDDKIQWYCETQNMRIAGAERAVLEEVNLHIIRDTFQSFTVKVIPDGNRARADSRNVSVQPDRLNTSSSFGAASLAGQAALQLDGSIAPIIGRFRKAGRNHRVRVESLAPNHTPIRILTMQADISVDDKSR